MNIFTGTIASNYTDHNNIIDHNVNDIGIYNNSNNSNDDHKIIVHTNNSTTYRINNNSITNIDCDSNGD